MSRISPLSSAELPEELAPLFAQISEQMGFTPNDARVMARHPAMFNAAAQLIDVIYVRDGVLAREIKQLAALAGSLEAGCSYCSSHAACGALRSGVERDKLRAVAGDGPAGEAFSPAEQAAINLARAAAQHPNAASDAHFETLRAHFSEEQIIELLGVIALFAFLNRWNTTLGSEVESEVAEVVRRAGVPVVKGGSGKAEGKG